MELPGYFTIPADHSVVRLADILETKQLEADIASGLISDTRHPQIPNYHILNYTHAATFSKEPWSECMEICRGLIYDAESGIVIARPFRKFWNWADERHPETLPVNLPTTVPTITDKLDGSLAIGYRAPNSDRVMVATRGSFTSDQAKAANQWLQNNDIRIGWPLGWTPVFEWISPKNRIVVRYDEPELVALALIRNRDGVEVNRDTFEKWSYSFRVRPVPLVATQEIERLAAEDRDDFEGYVAAWPRADREPLRVKIKLSTYRRLHRILFTISEKSIWEALVSGDSAAIMAMTADETLPKDVSCWVYQTLMRLWFDYSTKRKEIERVFESRPRGGDFGTLRKRYAEWVRQTAPDKARALFGLLDVDQAVWEAVKPNSEPRFNSQDAE